jgi:cyanophycinase
MNTREEGFDEARIKQMERASVVFFTGGDQLKITSQLGDTPVYQCMQEIYRRGATIAGTSAGAAAMPETMVIAGRSDSSYELSALDMAPGLGLISDVVIDSHFAERGRMGRLLGAVAQSPKNLGFGIDEDTAIMVGPDRCIEVLGTGAVYIVDGTGITYSTLTEKHTEGIVTILNVKLHVLGKGDKFDLNGRHPVRPDLAKAS